jgi:hypothetical protein
MKPLHWVKGDRYGSLRHKFNMIIHIGMDSENLVLELKNLNSFSPEKL